MKIPLRHMTYEQGKLYRKGGEWRGWADGFFGVYEDLYYGIKIFNWKLDMRVLH